MTSPYFVDICIARMARLDTGVALTSNWFHLFIYLSIWSTDCRVAGFHLQERADSAHANTHRRKTVCVSDLPQLVLAVWPPPVAQEDTHRRASVPVLGLRQVLPPTCRPPATPQACPPRQLTGADPEETTSSSSYHWASRRHGQLGRTYGADPWWGNRRVRSVVRRGNFMLSAPGFLLNWPTPSMITRPNVLNLFSTEEPSS